MLGWDFIADRGQLGVCGTGFGGNKHRKLELGVLLATEREDALVPEQAW